MNRTELLQYLENYLRNEGLRMNTVNGNTSAVRTFLDWLDTQNISYHDVSYSDLLAFINFSKEKGNAKQTINAKLLAIKHLYNCLEHASIVSYNPCQEMRLKGIIKRQPHDLLNWEELENLYKNFPSASITGKRNKAILAMMIYQGLNSGEIAKLELNDLKLEDGKIYIPSVARSNSRFLNLEPSQIIQLQKYIYQVRPVIMALKGENSSCDSLFISSGDGSRLDNSLTRLMKTLSKLNPNVKSPKQIRASVITYWLKRYGIRQVQYMTGHKYVSSTERYRTDLLETLQIKIDEIHPFR